MCYNRSMEIPTLRVETPSGPIEADIESDPAFLGIRVNVSGELAAIVEYVADEGRFVIRVYSRESDEPISNLDYETGEEQPSFASQSS